MIDWRNLEKWLETASEEELLEARASAEEAFQKITNPDVVADLKHACRRVDEELLARTELARMLQRHADRRDG